MMLRTVSFLTLVVLTSLAAAAQVPAPRPDLAEVPMPVPLADTDPPLVEVPGSSLRLNRGIDGVLPPVVYPGLAQLCRVQGDVTVHMILGVDGAAYPVGDAEGPPLLREAGRNYVRSVRFKPVQVDGRTVRAVSTSIVPFRLRGGGAAVTGYLVKVETGSPEMKPFSGKLEAQIKAWLSRIGLADRSGSAAEPAATLLVKASWAKTVRAKPEGTLTIQFLRLEDQDKAESSLLLGQRLLRFDQKFANIPASVGDEVFASRVQILLDRIVPPWEMPAKVREAESRLAEEMATGKPLKALNAKLPMLKVRYQPPPPPYPVLARIARIQGTVVVAVVFDEQGVPVMARAIDGPDQLRGTAEEYVMAWRFEPVMLDGKPVQAQVRLAMPFKLR